MIVEKKSTGCIQKHATVMFLLSYANIFNQGSIG